MSFTISDLNTTKLPMKYFLYLHHNSDPLVRSDGYEKILSARNEVTTCIRQMFGPEVDNLFNFESDSYVDMINWNKFHLTEHPCLQFYTQDQLEDLQYEISRQNMKD